MNEAVVITRESDKWLRLSLRRNGETESVSDSKFVPSTTAIDRAALNDGAAAQGTGGDAGIFRAAQDDGWRAFPQFVEEETECCFVEHFTTEKVIPAAAMLLGVVGFALVASFFVNYPGVELYCYAASIVFCAILISFLSTWRFFRNDPAAQSSAHEMAVLAFVFVVQASIWVLGKPRERECTYWGAKEFAEGKLNTDRSREYCVNSFGSFQYLILFGSLLWVRQRLDRVVVCAVVHIVSWHAATIGFGPNASTTEALITIFIIYALALVIVFSRKLEVLARKQFALMAATKRQQIALRQQSDAIGALLLSIMPDTLLMRLQAAAAESQSPSTFLIADASDDVSILFADLVDFTEFSCNLYPNVVAAYLSEFYRLLDVETAVCGVEKVKTIGDAYQAVCGIPHQHADHAERMGFFGFAVLNVLEAHNDGRDRHLQIRIGMHSGPTVGGIVSSTQLVYDIFGETNRIAKEVCEAAKPNTVVASSRTVGRLNPRVFDCARLAGVNSTILDSTGAVSFELFTVGCAAVTGSGVPSAQPSPASRELAVTRDDAADDLPRMRESSTPSVESQQRNPHAAVASATPSSPLPRVGTANSSSDSNALPAPRMGETPVRATMVSRQSKKSAGDVSLGSVFLQSNASQGIIDVAMEVTSVAESQGPFPSGAQSGMGRGQSSGAPLTAGSGPAGHTTQRLAIPRIESPPPGATEVIGGGLEQQQLLGGDDNGEVELISLEQRFNIFRWISSIGDQATSSAARRHSSTRGGGGTGLDGIDDERRSWQGFSPLPPSIPDGSAIGESPSELASNWDDADFGRGFENDPSFQRNAAEAEALGKRRWWNPFMTFADAALEAQYWSDVRFSERRLQLHSRVAVLSVLLLVLLIDGMQHKDMDTASSAVLVTTTLVIAACFTAHHLVGPVRPSLQLVCDVVALLCCGAFIYFAGTKLHSMIGNDTLYLRIALGSFAPFVATAYRSLAVIAADLVFIVVPSSYFTYQRVSYVPAAAASVIFSCFFVYVSLFTLERQRRLEFLNGLAMSSAMRQAERENRVQTKLLEAVLPKFIVPRMMTWYSDHHRQRRDDEQPPVSYLVNKASVMFIDLRIASLSSAVAIDALAEVRAQLAFVDALIATYKMLTKIKNIGDLVIVCGPIDDAFATAPGATEQAAEESLSFALQMKRRFPSCVVAAHAGRISVCVIGIVVVQLDVFGDTVNTCSRIADAAVLPQMSRSAIHVSLAFWSQTSANKSNKINQAWSGASSGATAALNPLASPGGEGDCITAREERQRRRNAEIFARHDEHGGVSVGDSDARQTYKVSGITTVQLRGKTQRVVLVSIEPISEAS